jgi:hypothetical protein
LDVSSASQPTRRTGSAPDADAAAPLVRQATALSRELRDEVRRLDPDGTGAHVELSSRLQNVRTRVDRIAAELTEPDADVGAIARRLAGARSDARSLFGECFDVAIRPVVREAGLGRGACEIADVLLGSVARRCGIPSWPHFTSIGAADFFTSTSHIIRLAYPPSPIWNLAIAVHELGHYCGPNWPGPREDDPYETFMTRVKVPAAYREELFADMFAVYTVGLAYVFACVIRLSPTGGGDASHPPDVQRAAWILAGLEALVESSEAESARILRKLAKEAGAGWEALVRTCGREAAPDDLATIRDEAERLFAAFRHSRPGAMYGDLRGARALAASFRKPAAARATPHPIDVLNAAWFLRLNPARAADPEALRAIEQWGGHLIRGFTCP